MTLYSLIVFAFVQIALNTQSTLINNIWEDTNNGWDDSNDYINGSLTTYHGWFCCGDGVIWYRNFSCLHYSTVTVNFTCNYGCGVEESGDDNEDYCSLYFNDPSHSTQALSISYDEGENIDLTLNETQKSNCIDENHNNGQLFSATAATFTDAGLYFLPGQEFEVAFGTHLSADYEYQEYLGFSFISVKCNQVPTPVPTTNPTSWPTSYPSTKPTLIPTNNPTVIPTENPTNEPTFPSNAPTMNPTINPTTDPSKIPSEQTRIPSINPTLLPSYGPSVFPSVYPSNTPTFLPTDEESIVSATDESVDVLTLTLIIGFSIAGLLIILAVILIICRYIRAKRQEETATICRSESTTIKMVNGKPMVMIVAQLETDSVNNYLNCDEEKALELQTPGNNNFVKRNILSSEDVFIISGNETAGGIGWNEEFQ